MQQADFPIFEQVLPNGKPLVYLDSAATTQKPRIVVQQMAQFYEKYNANVHRGVHYLAVQATSQYEGAREVVRQFLNARHSEEVIFTRGATESINLVAAGLQSELQPGDEVLITAMEHHANLIPWQQVCQKAGAKLQVLPINPAGELILEELDTLLNERTRLFAFVHISNTLGTINPIKQLIHLAKAKNIPVLVDAAQSAASGQLDVQALDCDFLVFSGHKLFGPTGIGVLYGKKERLEALPPYQFGGDMIRSVSFEESTFAPLPYRLEAGTPNIVGAIGLAAAIDYIRSLDSSAIAMHLQQLTAYAKSQLEQFPGLTLTGQAAHRAPIFSFTMQHAHPHDIATIVNEYGVALRAGHHCTQPLMDFYQIPASARASFSIYNTMEEVDVLVEALWQVRGVFGG
ncbi:MAG: cysteine desulfurase [Bacteroidota bacterium]